MVYQVSVLAWMTGADGETYIGEVFHETLPTVGQVVTSLMDAAMAGVGIYNVVIQQVDDRPVGEARPTLPTLAEALTRKTVLHPEGQPVDVPALLAAARGTGSARASKGASTPARTRGRRRMTAEQKQAVRERMRAYWASSKGQRQKRTMRAAMRKRTKGKAKR